MDRRDLLKGLLGAPVAVLVGGSILPSAAELEPYNDSVLVVPKTDLRLPESRQELLRLSVPDNAAFTQILDLPVQDGADLWVRVNKKPGGMMLASLFLVNAEKPTMALTGRAF